MSKLVIFLWTFSFFTPLGAALTQPNIIVLLTDQQRYTVHWPAGWVEKHLPSEARLKKHGLVYERAYTSSCMCSPSRAVMVSGKHFPENNVSTSIGNSFRTTFSHLPSKDYLENVISLIQKKSDYEVVWKGKWHLSYPQAGVGNPFSEQDIAFMELTYGPEAWNPPDAGNAIAWQKATAAKLATLGGSYANNDGRFLNGVKDPKQTKGWGESILDYLEKVSQEKERKPFCLFISFVNPHDIWVYPDALQQTSYAQEAFKDLGIELPDNLDDNLSSKPSVQAIYRNLMMGDLADKSKQLEFVNFYAYLHTVVDQQIQAVLDALEKYGLLDNTVIIRSADHGEHGCSHGLREKAYTAYEVIHIPLIISNPQLFPEEKTTSAFYSHIDLLPTIADLIGISLKDEDFAGVSQVPVIMGKKEKVRDQVLYTYDDLHGGVPSNAPGSHIRALRKENWTYAVYFSAGGGGFEYELYDLEKDPGQMNNLLYGYEFEQHRTLASKLHKELTKLMKHESALPVGFQWPTDPFSQ